MKVKTNMKAGTVTTTNSGANSASVTLDIGNIGGTGNVFNTGND